MRRISTSNGCRSFKSVDCGLRPRASETLLLAPANLPWSDFQGSSVNRLELIFSKAVMGRKMFVLSFNHRKPPAMTKVSPVIHDESADARKTAVPEMSSG